MAREFKSGKIPPGLGFDWYPTPETEQPTRAQLGQLAMGSRVRDRFNRTGTVQRAAFGDEVLGPGGAVARHLPVTEHVGVLWDGRAGAIIEYPEDWEFEVISGAILG
ncbi:MAG: hypothetical protein V4502_08180 [Pseudomonadota bacterium]